MLYYLLVYLVKPFFYLIKRPKIDGKYYLRIHDKAIFACNHLSMLDPILLALISPRPIHFMAKKELFKSGIGNLFFRSLLVFPVDRGHADITSVKQAIELLDKGKVFGIFPEGHRGVTGEIDKLERGTAFFALRTGAPIVPIYIDPEARKNGRVHILIGEPIYMKSLKATVDKSAQNEVILNRLDASMRRLAAQAAAQGES